MVFPPACGGCGKFGERWCKDCRAGTTPLPEPLCEICGEPRSSMGICGRCLNSRPAFEKLRSWVAFNGSMREALHKLKYRRDVGFGETLALPLAEFLDSQNWNVDLAVPIPLSPQRLSERGYNQVGLFAYPLALAKDLTYAPRALHRSRHTRSQVGLSAVERRKNVRGAFRATNNLVAGKSVLLLDDVATTGATLSSASRTLVEAGAKRVYALTVARALTRYGLDRVD